MSTIIFDENVPVIIPAYEPDESFVSFCRRLKHDGAELIVVDDGSGEAYRTVFDSIEEMGCVVLRHVINLGKGRALKEAFNWVLLNRPEARGVVTADSDGQHRPEDIARCADELMKHSDSLILGSRQFSNDDVPWKSRFGNKLTRRILSFLCGLKVSDTQTGLRGMSIELMKEFLTVRGERFEYEMNMLLEANGRFAIREIPIETIYDSRDNHMTHFDPLRDSIRIYRTIFAYSLSAVLSTVFDFIVFGLVFGISDNVFLSTACGRLCSSGLNFLVNRNMVFRAEGHVVRQVVGYFLLVILSGTASALAVYAFKTWTSIPVIIAKMVVDTLLFILNYYVQRAVIFKRRQNVEES